MLAALILTSFAVAGSQEPPPVPVPEQPPAPEQQPAPESAPPSGQEPVPEAAMDPMAQMQEIMDLINVVRDGFTRVDKKVREVRTTADSAAADDAPFRSDLDEAIAEADGLLSDIDDLLEKLPQMDQQNPQPSGGGGGGGQRDPQQNGDEENQPDPSRLQDGEKPEDGREGDQEDQRGAGQLPEALRQLILFDLRSGYWGALPPQLQSAVENATAEDLPLRYRRWLEEYHRRGARQRP